MVQKETESLETTPFLGSECSRMRYSEGSLPCVYPQEEVLHSPNSYINFQPESGPSCSRPPIPRRSFSAGSLLSPPVTSINFRLEHNKATPLSPNHCKRSEQQQQLLSSSERFRDVRKWVELRLENSGSVARDHLASERTFLAYMRTSLAVASTGVALVQLFSVASVSSLHVSSHRLHVYIRSLGASAVIVGLLVLLIGIIRYFTVQVALTKGFFPVARLATGFVAMMLGVLVILTFGIIIAGKLEPKGK